MKKTNGITTGAEFCAAHGLLCLNAWNDVDSCAKGTQIGCYNSDESISDVIVQCKPPDGPARVKEDTKMCPDFDKKTCCSRIDDQDNDCYPPKRETFSDNGNACEPESHIDQNLSGEKGSCAGVGSNLFIIR